MKRIMVIITLLASLFGCASRNSALRSEQRIIFFGDSITEQGVKPNGYVTIIRDSLAATGY
ncbi:MAG: G-D-S-L family lipolytic protein, partial [Bacteroidota bacterium]